MFACKIFTQLLAVRAPDMIVVGLFALQVQSRHRKTIPSEPYADPQTL